MATKNGNNSHIPVREPSALFNAIISVGVKAWTRHRVKFRLHRNVTKLNRPAIVLCNHGSFIDFAYMALTLKNDKPHIVTTRQYFYSKRLAWLLRKLGCIPKSLFTTDFESIKDCLQVLKNDGVLVICPEARLCTVGETEGVQDSVMRFLYKMGQSATIYTLTFSGDYLALPKWARQGSKRFVRRGSPVEGELNLLYDKGQSGNVSLEEFAQTVASALSHNEFDWLATHPEIHYSQGNLAVGLQNVLYRCPNCNSEFSLTSAGNTLSCSHCGATFTMDDRYIFTSGRFANLQEWYHWQTNELRAEIEADPNWQLADSVTLYHSSLDGKSQLREAGKGRCVFDRRGLVYTGTDDGVDISKTFPISRLYRVLFGAGADFEVYDGTEIWYFVPNDTRTCVKWYIASGILCDN